MISNCLVHGQWVKISERTQTSNQFMISNCLVHGQWVKIS